MKQALILIVILVVAGLAYWFLIKDSSLINDKSSASSKQELVPPALPE